MDKNKVQGALDDAAGRAKRQVGEWTGDTNAQAGGASQQLKGKVEKAIGNVKDAVREAESDLHEKMQEVRSRRDHQTEQPDAAHHN